MPTSGALNGTGVFVAMDTVVPGTTYLMIGGQTSHSLTLNNNIIDITNKTSAQFRELLGGEGTQSIDLTLEMVFNSEVTFVSLRDLSFSKAIAAFEIDVGGILIQFEGMVASWADTSPDGDKLSSSVSIQSTGAFVWAGVAP
jgi:predicted secreted protein